MKRALMMLFEERLALFLSRHSRHLSDTAPALTCVRPCAAHEQLDIVRNELLRLVQMLHRFAKVLDLHAQGADVQGQPQTSVVRAHAL